LAVEKESQDGPEGPGAEPRVVTGAPQPAPDLLPAEAGEVMPEAFGQVMPEAFGQVMPEAFGEVIPEAPAQEAAPAPRIPAPLIDETPASGMPHDRDTPDAPQSGISIGEEPPVEAASEDHVAPAPPPDEANPPLNDTPEFEPQPDPELPSMRHWTEVLHAHVVPDDALVARIGSAAHAHEAALPPEMPAPPSAPAMAPPWAPETTPPLDMAPPLALQTFAPPPEPVYPALPRFSETRSYAGPADVLPAASRNFEVPRAPPGFGRYETAGPAPQSPSTISIVKTRALPLIRKGAYYAAYAAVCYLAFVVVLIFAYRFVNPPVSTLMLFRVLGGEGIEKSWAPLDRISPHLMRAVVVSEDGRFCDHWGVDLGAIKEAVQRSASGGIPRGASTISMQVTKNLFLWPQKSYLRKVIEIPLTLLSEIVWPKWRMLEIYLNVAEWGPGIYGAEAASRYHFHKPASRLSEGEAALLAASLPNPALRDAGDPGPRTSRKAGAIQARMRIAGSLAACVTGRAR
jgi:monofunctional biosynthetic peptidoglycan transglycosylase